MREYRVIVFQRRGIESISILNEKINARRAKYALKLGLSAIDNPRFSAYRRISRGIRPQYYAEIIWKMENNQKMIWRYELKTKE